MIDWKTITWFVLTLLLMGFFAGIEMAFFSANRLSIELKKKQGGYAADLLAKFVDTPATFLGTTLTGFTIFMVFFSLQVDNLMKPVWQYLNWELQWQIPGVVALFTEIILAVFVVLIFAEFIPRAIFRARSISLLTSLSWVTEVFYSMFSPIANALINVSEWVLKYVIGVRVDQLKEPFKRSDLKNLFQHNSDEERQERNSELLEKAQELPKVKIRQCLVPRKEIVGVNKDSTIDQVKSKFIETKLSKLIVFEHNIDHIIGYVHQLDLFKKPQSLHSILLPIPAVPESMSAADLISKFTRERKSIAWVVDEFGGTAGIISMEDVLEELFGEIQDEYDTEEFVEKQISENEYIFSGRLELDYIESKYGLEFPKNDSETLSGYIINFHETIPRQKERIIIADHEFDIINVSDTRIEMVKMKKLK